MAHKVGGRAVRHKSSVSKRSKYLEDQKQKSPFKWKLWGSILLIIGALYMYMDKVEEFFIQDIYLENQLDFPKETTPTMKDEDLEKLIEKYQKDNMLPYYDDEISVILLVLDSYKGKNTGRAVTKLLYKAIDSTEKKIKKKYYVIEMDNTMIMEDSRYKQESPWDLLMEFKFESLFNYALLPTATDYVDINNLVRKLQSKFTNSIISINIGTKINDSVLSYETLMDIGVLTKKGVVITISPGKYDKESGLTKRITDFKYYTMQRTAIKLIERGLIDITNFKISLNADKIYSERMKNYPELNSEYLNMMARSTSNSKSLKRRFIKKWVSIYPELFYSDQAPLDYFVKNKDLFKKEYDRDVKMANPKVNFKETNGKLQDKIKEDMYY